MYLQLSLKWYLQVYRICIPWIIISRVPPDATTSNGALPVLKLLHGSTFQIRRRCCQLRWINHCNCFSCHTSSSWFCCSNCICPLRPFCDCIEISGIHSQYTFLSKNLALLLHFICKTMTGNTALLHTYYYYILLLLHTYILLHSLPTKENS